MRLTTSAAAFASRMMRSTVFCARSRFGGSAVSQRWQACELATMAASGWFTSCAMEAESSARLAAWLARARLSCARRSSSCARTSPSMSRQMTFHCTIAPSALRIGAARVSTQRYSPSKRRRRCYARIWLAGGQRTGIVLLDARHVVGMNAGVERAGQARFSRAVQFFELIAEEFAELPAAIERLAVRRGAIDH